MLIKHVHVCTTTYTISHFHNDKVTGQDCLKGYHKMNRVIMSAKFDNVWIKPFPPRSSISLDE